MKQMRNLINGLVACGVALAVVSTVSAQEQVSAKVVRIKGEARYSTGNNVWQPLKTGTVLSAGSSIQTGQEIGSYVDVVLGEGDGTVSFSNGLSGTANTSTPASVSYQPKAEQSVMRVSENTVLNLDKLDASKAGADEVNDIELDLKSGTLFGNVKKVSAASKFEIKVPNGVAGIRGTTFFASTVGGGTFGIYQGRGVFAHVGPDGQVKTEVINAGYAFDGKTVSLVPISLLPFPPISPLAPGALPPTAPVTHQHDPTVTPTSPH